MAGKEKPKIITDKTEMRTWTSAMRSQGKTIAFVPTMGFLHDGHLSLVEEAHKHTQLVVVSIYVNPGQFAHSEDEDFSTYPSDFEGDIRKLIAVPGGVDVVFHPHNLYDYGVESSLAGNGSVSNRMAVVSRLEESGTAHETWVRVERLEKGMCGARKPIFFRGIATIAAKLFNIVEPDVAVFGKKDYQQLQIVRRMVRDLDFSINIMGSEIVRDADGLAMSSRNVGLSSEERQKALSINRSLSKAKSAAERGELNCKSLKNLVVDEIREAGGELDYAEIVEQESLEVVEEIKSPVVILVAAWFGTIRLLDNMEISI